MYFTWSCLIGYILVNLCNCVPYVKRATILHFTDPIEHAEGPHYDLEKNMLYYVDTFGATVYRYNLMTTKLDSYKLKDHNSVAIIIPIQDGEDEFIVGADRTLYKMTWPCSNIKPTLKKLIMIEKDKKNNQFNDGKVDVKGRLWIGTLTRNSDLSVSKHGGSLYMFKGDVQKGIYEEKIPNTSISNGIAWSKDYKHMYYVDSEDRKVYSYIFDQESGKIDNKKVVFDVTDHPDLSGIPDGMTIDKTDTLWVALFGGKAIINVDPKTSKLIRVLEMPVTYITSLCFGGPSLNTLFVTSSRLKLTDEELKKEPFAGSLFSVTISDLAGLPAHNFQLKLCNEED